MTEIMTKVRSTVRQGSEEGGGITIATQLISMVSSGQMNMAWASTGPPGQDTITLWYQQL